VSYAALARCYDSFTQNMDYEKRMDFVCALLSGSDQIGSTDWVVLDLACGTGTCSRALLDRGYDVIGVDASVEMLSIAREKCPEMLLLHQKLEQLDLYGTAQGAICLTDSVNHIIEPKDVRKFFERLALFLDPGAPFVFDVNTLHKHEHVLADNTFVYENEDITCVWHNEWLPEEKMTKITLDFGDEAEQFYERVYSIDELTTWLNEAEFAVEQVLDAPGEEKERVYFVARKQ